MIKFFRVGKIISLHGIKGEVKAFSTTDDVKRFDDLKEVFLSKNQEEENNFDYKLTITSTKYIKDTCILKFEGFDNIEASTKLIGYSIYIDSKDAVKLSTNEYFVSDLIGLKAYYDDIKVGDVIDVSMTKANGILCVKNEKKEILVPFIYDYVEKIDKENGKIYLRNFEGL